MKVNNKEKLILSFVEDSNGYVKSSDVVRLGISKTYFKQIALRENLEKVSHGVYCSPNAWRDPFYEIQLVYPSVVFSHETALYLHGLTEQEPMLTHVTVYAGYNATALRKIGCCIHTTPKSRLNQNVVSLKDNYGNSISVYNMERTICDMVKMRHKMDIQVFQYAMKTYMKCKNKNIFALMECANNSGIEDEIRKYTEVLL